VARRFTRYLTSILLTVAGSAVMALAYVLFLIPTTSCPAARAAWR